jgi:hypothetical protein
MSMNEAGHRKRLTALEVRGILALLTGLKCRSAMAFWPDSTFLTLGWRDESDQDPVTGGAWTLSNLSAQVWLAGPQSGRSKVAEHNSGALSSIIHHRLTAVHLNAKSKALCLEFEGDWTLSILPDRDERDPETLYWELLTPEEPRRAVRARPPSGLFLESYFYPED